MLPITNGFLLGYAVQAERAWLGKHYASVMVRMFDGTHGKHIEAAICAIGKPLSIPKCTARLVVDGILIGEVCHIRGDKPGAARYDTSQTDNERHAYDNLIAMCPNHHTVIDSDEEAYSVARIVRMKAQHEAKVDSMPEEDANRIAIKIANSGVLTIGQSGGISAESVHVQTLNLSNGASSDAIVKDRNIVAVGLFWNCLVSLRKEFGDLIQVDSLLTSKEIDDFFKNGWPTSHESPHFCATLKSPSLGFPRATGWRIIREGESCARRRKDLISFMNS